MISGGLEQKRSRFGSDSMLADEVGLVQVTGAENATGDVDVVLVPLQHMHVWHFSVSFRTRRYKEAGRLFRRAPYRCISLAPKAFSFRIRISWRV